MMIEPVIEIFGAFNGHVTQQIRELYESGQLVDSLAYFFELVEKEKS